MPYSITCFIPDAGSAANSTLVNQFRASGCVKETILMTSSATVDEYPCIFTNNLWSTHTIKLIAENSKTAYTLIYTRTLPLELGQLSLNRFLQVARDTNAVMVYSDYWQKKDGELVVHPLIDYQKGSLRDDFDFGPVLLIRTDVLIAVANEMDDWYDFAALYDLRLMASRRGDIVRIPEYLYTAVESDTRLSGEKQFDYVDPKNRDLQIEMEKVCTSHLKMIGGWLAPKFDVPDLTAGSFDVEVSVIIPVRNRQRTISDAVKSVLM